MHNQQQRCDFTELIVEQCSHCQAQAAEVRWFTAQFTGTCVHPACKQAINVGDRIHETAEGTYEHARCARRMR